ncbi:MAG: ribulose-phosphate 3-epimerase [Clostridia bacterium]|nr:ribulose-phosphate 3-epimerase [Clostridia bacterium]
MKHISPSILASNMLELGNEIKKIEESGAKYVHIDIMDGCFVPNISFGMPVISAVRGCTDLIIDVHAMIVEPDRYIDEFIRCGADIITFHYEALDNTRIVNAIEKIKAKGIKAGISIKPKTEAEVLYPYIKDIDMVLIMTVEPGFGGQKFMVDTMDKVRKVREYALSIGKELDIQVDGGINDTTIKTASDAGANIFVLGTGFFKAEKTKTAEEILLNTL